MDKNNLIKEVRQLAQKAKRRSSAFSSRGLYNPRLDILEEQSMLAVGEKNRGTFTVSKYYSIDELEKLKRAFRGYIKYAPTYTQYKQKAKEFASENKVEGKLSDILKAYSTYKESLEYAEDIAGSLGSPTLHDIYTLTREQGIKNSTINNAFSDIANKYKGVEYKRSDILKELAQRLDVGGIETL